MRLRIIISWAPYPQGSIREDNQYQALRRLISIAPEWCDFSLATLPGEKRVNQVGIGPEELRLPREASSVTGGRPMPYFRDVLEAALEGLGPKEWGGTMNSDIVVTPEFFRRVEEASESSMEAIIGHRTDVQDMSTRPEEGRKVNRRRCCDGFFITGRIWDEKGSTIPDYVLGYPYWDTGMIWWTKMHKLKTVRLIDHEILHVNHGGRWNYKDPGTKHNGKLCRWMVNELLGTKTKAERRRRYK